MSQADIHERMEESMKRMRKDSPPPWPDFVEALCKPNGEPCHPADYDACPDEFRACPCPIDDEIQSLKDAGCEVEMKVYPTPPGAMVANCTTEEFLGQPAIEVETSDTQVEVDFDKVRGFLDAGPTAVSESKWKENLSSIADVKDSNPKDAVGIRKVPYSTLPTPVLAECGVAMLEGAIKYGRHNYRVIGVRASVYYDAVVARHLAAWWEGEDVDEESGISHISKAIAGLMVLRDAQIRGKMVDDRPVGTKGFIKELNKKVAEMMDRLPEAKDAYIANGQPQDEYRS